jgi:hypothetical protein
MMNDKYGVIELLVNGSKSNILLDIKIQKASTFSKKGIFTEGASFKIELWIYR